MGEVNFVKGQYYTILALIFAIIVAIFAISNAGPVDISFLYWHYSISQALVILLSAAIGAIIVGTIGLFGQIRYSVTIRGLNNRIKELEKEKEELNQKVIELQNYKLAEEKTKEQSDAKEEEEEKGTQTL
ncbi:MAG: Uncharacterized protein XD65_0434 [Caldanaerobacter subterraneus]|jgi:uncharacterized integral membrane protein|nr:MAG: hypothetical protein XD37_1045 [Thermoanaerobacter thermocopriae]KUK35237.1 MAG: Uncharacterized protein XD65_0434 [Caldanaerobacter subterraneus]MBZ4656720.1 hypothetical protein [Thermoanaerobacter sp.]MDI3529262.1 hypothetical protein [Thermoanaerobacter sp.]